MSYPRSLPPSFDSFPSRPPRPESIGQRSQENAGFNSSSSARYSSYSSLPFEHQRRIAIENASPSSRHLPSQLDPFNRDDSRHYRTSPFPRQYCQLSSCMSLDENKNPIYDEALQFVSSSRSLINTETEARKDEICAEFVSEHFKCPICLDVLLETTAVSCGHRFCRYCIETWLQIKPSCPVCEEPVTIRMKQFDVDNAIESVANMLSDEWKVRRMILEALRDTPTGTSLSTSDFPPSLAYIARETKRVGKKCLRFIEKVMQITFSAIYFSAEWMYENTGLEELAKGILILCISVFMIYFGDQIVNFTQYMYYAIWNYKRDVPASEQIVAVYGEEGATQSIYQDFKELPDSIFAKFLRLFYAEDNMLWEYWRRISRGSDISIL